MSPLGAGTLHTKNETHLSGWHPGKLLWLSVLGGALFPTEQVREGSLLTAWVRFPGKVQADLCPTNGGVWRQAPGGWG